MRDYPLEITILIEYYSIRPWATARIYLVSLQDWKFLVRAAVWEIKPLVVVVGMRISIATDSLAGLIVITALLDRGVDIRLVIAG